jgi:DNA recombination protein RmuC
MAQPLWIPLIAGLMVGAFAGAFSAWLMMRRSIEAAASRVRGEDQVEIARLNERLSSEAAQRDTLRSQLGTAEAGVGQLRQQLGELRSERVRFEERASRVPMLEDTVKVTTAENERLKRELAELSTLMEAERKQASEKLALLAEAREQLTASFRSLANDILEEKAHRFTELNKTNVAQILDPLKAKIQEFQAKVEEVYVQEGKDRAGLAEQVKRLMELNQQLSDDANNLAQALKGSSKRLGNWGEMILERILENSGLRKNEQYLMRPTYTREDGSRAQPDAVVLLPDDRNLVVDAKVSLAAWEEYGRADNDIDQAAALQRHVAALRAHVEGLSVRNYQGLEGLNTPDFVVMFVPIEASFIVAMTNDSKLWEEAWKKNVILVSPTSFLFVVRIVATLWTQEDQKRHFHEIARRGADLYDKLVGFIEDLKTIGQRLEQAKDSYDSAYAKLCTGKGNVIRRAELLKQSGVRPSKAFPPDLVESAIEIPALPGATEGGEQSDPNH